MGMLAAEGQVHKRQRREGTPAFSIQNMRALVPVTFQKGFELRDRWMALIAEAKAQNHQGEGDAKPAGWAKLDVCHWISRATFDVIGLAGAFFARTLCALLDVDAIIGFDYQFNSIHDESNELFLAYKEMFEIAVSQQGGGLWELAIMYVPILDRISVCAYRWAL